jgi:hypothetical protein
VPVLGHPKKVHTEPELMRASDQTEIVGDLFRGDERTGGGESTIREVIGNQSVKAIGFQVRYVDSNVRRSV